MSKTRKREKTGPKAIDNTCRNHGTCPSCQSARKRKEELRNRQADVDMMFREIWPDVQFRVVESEE